MPLWIPLILLVAGGLVIGGAVAVHRMLEHLRRRTFTVPSGWVQVNGTVAEQQIDVVPQNGGYSQERGPMVRLERPIIDFTTTTGIPVRFTSSSAAGYMPRAGAEVVVYYSPADPRQAMLGPESQPSANRATIGCASTLMSIVLGGLGTVLAAVGVIMLLAR